MLQNNITSENTIIVLKELANFNSTHAIKREDLVHPQVSGNKFRKLKYNISEAITNNYASLLTFGGAYSNHIAATAVAGKMAGIKTIGVIRGEELAGNHQTNPTLMNAIKNGMQLYFVSREHYSLKHTEAFLQQLKEKFGDFFLVPEGGTNTLAVKGCSEILTQKDKDFNYIAASVGTGGTLAGLVMGAHKNQSVVGYSALKGIFQKKEIQKYTSKTNYTITDTHCFGGYAKIDSSLIRFMNNFKDETGILLDPVYTGKLLYGIVEDIKNGRFAENSRILAIHTGGLQGILPMNKKLKKKNLPQIEI